MKKCVDFEDVGGGLRKMEDERFLASFHNKGCSFHAIITIITRARLYLAQSEAGDSGNYTCVCDHNLKQTVRLVVTLGTYTIKMMMMTICMMIITITTLTLINPSFDNDDDDDENNYDANSTTENIDNFSCNNEHIDVIFDDYAVL